ncbi:rod shape-determining protein MreC [Novosphingobium sp. 9]|uniref:rod shape-determining protein MreC n=1 Tax=Novosphingobium sp. 9 TaxID=2025349 RepID=UPI0021B5C807|nr:rod shape-determining protein MreC [Novosphingobium sp. 9]
MAPPANRRTGFSRRAQYSTFASYIAWFVGVAVGVILLVVSLTSPESFAPLRTLAADAGEPAARTIANTRAGSLDWIRTVSGFFQTGGENARLRRELAVAKVRLVEAQATVNENHRLKALLQLGQDDDTVVAYGRLTSSTSSSVRRYATLGAGADKGVVKGMPVRSRLGLIGRVLEVGARSSRVLLITDTESVVPVRRVTDGVPAFAQGNGDGTIRIRLINLGLNPLKVGDVMVTSGSGGLYRPGTPMVVIIKLLRDGGIAQVLTNPSDSEFVLVQKTWAPPTPPAHQDTEATGTVETADESSAAAASDAAAQTHDQAAD